MTILIIIFTFLISLCIGSFLNVVIARLPLERDDLTLSSPRSHCPQCQHTIQPWHNIPILSYCLLKGRCAYCQKSISIQYPAVELLTALLSVAMILFFGETLQGFSAVLFIWILIPLIVIDLQRQILPDVLNYILLWSGLCLSLSSVFVSSTPAIIGAAGGYLFFWLLAKTFKFFYKKEGLGHGDFKLIAALGAWVGWQGLPWIMLISSGLGLVAAVTLILCKKNSRSTPIAFGPFLAVAGIVVLMWTNL